MKFSRLIRETYFLLVAGFLIVMAVLFTVREVFGATFIHWLDRSLN